MPGVHRLFDLVSGHACPPFGAGAAPETMAAGGSPNVLVNGSPAVRMTDLTDIHPCIWPDGYNPHEGMYVGIRNVLVNGLPCQAELDFTTCESVALEGSPNVIVGG